MTRDRALVGILLFAGWLVRGEPALAEFRSDERACREGISKAGQKLADTVVKTLGNCHKRRSTKKIDPGVDCNDLASADTKRTVAATAAKLIEQTLAECADASPGDLGYDECPTPCAAVIATFQDVADCEVCLLEQSGEAMMIGAQGLPDPLELSRAEAACHAAIARNLAKHFTTIVKERRKCQKAQEAAGATDTSACEESDPSGKIATVRAKAEAAVGLKCAIPGINLADLDLCSDLSVGNLLSCIFAGSSARGEATFQWLYGLVPISVTTTTVSPSTTSTTLTSTTTTTLPLCSVTFGITTLETLGALQFEVDYDSAPGEFVGEGFAVSCTALIAGGSTVIQDDDARRILGAAIIKEAGFAGPVDVARCSFAPSDRSIATSKFGITVVDATTPDFLPVRPTVAITVLDCPFG